MIRSTWKFRILSAALTVLSAAPTLAQQVKGDSEVGLSGSFTLTPMTNPVYNSKGVQTGTQSTVSTSGTITVDYGFYFTRSDFFGVDESATISGTPDATTGGTDTSIIDYTTFRYRHLFGKKGAKVYPFVGAGGGFIGTADSENGVASTGEGLYDAEAGLKFYVSEKTAFELAYTYLGEVQNGTTTSLDQITFGFTYVFGGPRSKH
jgi:hypothetical protein